MKEERRWKKFIDSDDLTVLTEIWRWTLVLKFESGIDQYYWCVEYWCVIDRTAVDDGGDDDMIVGGRQWRRGIVGAVVDIEWQVVSDCWWWW